MRNFQILTVAAMVLILGFGSTLMAQKGQATRDEVRVNWTENQPQARLLFVDENGDGICDQLRDHDGDGIPNAQDPDWERPQDGNGFQNGKGMQQDRRKVICEGRPSVGPRFLHLAWIIHKKCRLIIENILKTKNLK